uniref:PHD-type domain-containing protein n=1 Tax=Leptocylindrus danicus TaxID=163516 RepID=A0A7S2LR92_9STRA
MELNLDTNSQYFGFTYLGKPDPALTTPNKPRITISLSAAHSQPRPTPLCNGMLSPSSAKKTVTYPKKSSEVGPNHQVSKFPAVGSKWKDGGGNVMYEKVWDSKLAETSKEDAYGFLESLPGNKKEMGMRALHKLDYHTRDAETFTNDLMSWYRKEWTRKEKEKFNITIWNTRKNFREITKATGRSYSDCLVYYLSVYKKTHDYQQLKKLRVAEREKFKAEYGVDETCEVCDEGGQLIVCEICERGYHLKCLNPPLSSIPAGAWFCPRCLSKRITDLKRDILGNIAEVKEPLTKKAKTEGAVESCKAPPSWKKATTDFAERLCKVSSMQ